MLRQDAWKSSLVLLAGVMICATGAIAQQAPGAASAPSAKAAADVKLPEFDVASVKENKSGDHRMMIKGKPDGFESSNIPLKVLIANAYGIKQDLVSGGPAWVDSVGFDIDAKITSPDAALMKSLTGEQREAMLRPVLADRFKLKVHIEAKVLPIYELVVAKGGPKLTESKIPPPNPDEPPSAGARKAGMMTMRPGEFSGQGIGLSGLATRLSSIVHRTVIDKTGLDHEYDFDLKWTPEEHNGPGGDADAEAGPSVFTALQEQLGLRLQSTKGEVQTLVIDSVERPSEN